MFQTTNQEINPNVLCEKHIHSLHSQSSMVESLKTIAVTKFANYVHKTDLGQHLD